LRQAFFKALSELKGISKGASEADIKAVEVALGFGLPAIYRTLALVCDGFLLENGLSFYPLCDLVERNETNETQTYCDGFILIGDNSGSKGILIERSKDDPSVFASDLGDLDIDGFTLIAPALSELIINKFDDNYLRSKGVIP
jgi:hypothetical protein